jgi:hypothetical protein
MQLTGGARAKRLLAREAAAAHRRLAREADAAHRRRAREAAARARSGSSSPRASRNVATDGSVPNHLDG